MFLLRRLVRNSTAMDVRRTFTEIFERNLWKGTHSVSGPGSGSDATKILREQLAHLFCDLRIRALCDAACGDANWIIEITGELDSYVGVDIVPALIKANRKRHRRPNHVFRVADIVTEVLPKADAILCRDCLVHLPLNPAMAAVANFKASGATYLISTTFPNVAKNKPSGIGGWRPLNLARPPFNFPEPVRIIRERLPNPDDPYNDKSLGVWSLADIPFKTVE